MCLKCDKEIIEQDILDSDLVNLPFKLKKWRCLVPGCRGGCKVRDYDMSPFFFDPLPRRWNVAEDKGRGGWWNMTGHFYICSKHGKDWKRIEEMMCHKMTGSYLLSKITDYKTTKKKKRNESIF